MRLTLVVWHRREISLVPYLKEKWSQNSKCGCLLDVGVHRDLMDWRVGMKMGRHEVTATPV